MKNNLLERLDASSVEIVRAIGALAQGAAMKAYLVGGPVRDLLLKKSNLDLDVAIEGKAMAVAKDFAHAYKGKLVTYPAFGTATVSLSKVKSVDFVTARKETYARPGAFPTVTFSNITDDLFRRDFTINAMAIALNPDVWGQFIDPFDGIGDLKAKRIRILHARSFIDDPTRILRAARFKCRLGFHIEQGTSKSLKAALKEKFLEKITAARYLKEYDKILNEKTQAQAIELLKRWGCLRGEINAAHR